MIKGFTIGGFRNFANPPTWIRPLGRINIFLGANNSGKSNILRYIHRVLAPSFLSEKASSPLSGIDVSAAGEAGPHYVQVMSEIDFEHIGKDISLRSDFVAIALQSFMLDGEIVSTVSFPKGKGSASVFPLDRFPPSNERPAQPFESFWQSISRSSGGGYKEHWYPQVANWVARYAIKEGSCHYIKTFRTLPTRLTEFETEYPRAEGAHLIDELAVIERPRWNEQHKKQDFDKLERFVRLLLENEGARIEISSDKTHVIVHLNGDSLPLEALGSGIHEVFMIAAEIVLREDDIILLEEPETHLHPGLQKKLMLFLANDTKSQLFITTHSSAILDTVGAHVFSVENRGDSPIVRPLITSHSKYEACRNLGYKASDILQSNCLLWVEGPSDRIYICDWIKRKSDNLIEGVHYSVMFYGGRLASHLSFNDGTEELIQLLPINRSNFILIDSDKGSQNQEIRLTKKRLIEEISKVSGLSWLTEGREIENYYKSEDVSEAIQKIHRNVSWTNVGGNRFSKPLLYRVESSSEDKVANKILVAEWLVNNKEPDWGRLDLELSISNLVGFIEASNR